LERGGSPATHFTVYASANMID